MPQPISPADDSSTGNDAPAIPCDGDCCGSGMCAVTVTLPLVSLRLFDTPVGYTPPVGYDVHTTLTYNQFEAAQPASMNYSNVGPQWSTNWIGFIQDDPAQPGARVRRVAAGGGAYDYTGYNSASGAFAREMRTPAQLVLVTRNPVSYERRLDDGSKEVYAASNGATSYPRRVFLSRIVDPYGNTLTLNYDTTLRLTAIKDAIGQNTTFTYGNAANSWLITRITDPFGRTAQLAYDSRGRLSSITDAVGITSSFDYSGISTNISALHTPYGATRFTFAGTASSRSLSITNPLGNTSRTEFNAGAVIASEQPPVAGWRAGDQRVNNTFYWDGEAHARAPGNYTQARVSHWLTSSAGGSQISSSQESEKLPLETRRWYARDGQAAAGALQGAQRDAPNQIARKLPDGSAQVTKIAYTASGNPSQNTDPLGRQVQTSYDSTGIDITAIRRKTTAGLDTLAQLSYGAGTPHRPVTYTDAAGQTWRMSYNAQGQLLTVTDPQGRTTTNVYDAKGYLTQVVNAQKKVQQSYTYDSAGRIASRTDSEGHTLKYQYDNLDRLTRITHPSGSGEIYTWTHLDRTAVSDRYGRTTQYAYDAARNLIKTTDPEGHVTQYGYDKANRLIKLTDPNGSITTWQRDIQGRVIAKTYPNGDKTTYTYDSAGRLASQTDALGQTRRYSYAADDRPTAIDYPNPVNPTAAIALQWDKDYPRLNRITGAGNAGQINLAYVPAKQNGAGQIQSETSPQGTVTYAYDSLGRVSRRTANGKPASWGYDALGRVSSETNSLGQWQTSYLGQTSQPVRTALPAFSLDYGYEVNMYDRRLTSLTWQSQSGTATQTALTTWEFNYQTDVLGHVISSRDAVSGKALAKPLTEGTQSYSYDRTGWLTQASGAVRQEKYTLDPASNLTGQSITASGRDTWNWQAQLNRNNQLTRTQQTQGQNTKQFNPVYNANGQLTADASRTYQWDANGNLIKIVNKVNGHITDMAYDGLGRRVRIQERASATASPTTTNYQWCGTEICQKLDGSNKVIAEYFNQGETRASTSTGGKTVTLLYQKDQLGSIRGTATPDGLQQGSRTYTAYGQTDQSSGTQPDKGYAGMFLHEYSGLYLTRYRAYDPVTGRWLSRDPIEEQGGVNLYGYVEGDPVNFTDPDGLQAYSGQTPPSNIPGGPWTPAGPGQKPGTFWGQKVPGGHEQCRYVPDAGNGGPESATNGAYWKTKTPQGSWNHFDSNGNPITSEQAHPGNGAQPKISPEPTLPPPPASMPWWVRLGVGVTLMLYHKPAN